MRKTRTSFKKCSDGILTLSLSWPDGEHRPELFEVLYSTGI